MTTNLTARDRAQREVHSLVSFGVHLLAFTIVNGAAVATGAGGVASPVFWGWGIGVVAHGVTVLPVSRRLYEGWVERTAQRYQG